MRQVSRSRLSGGILLVSGLFLSRHASAAITTVPFTVADASISGTTCTLGAAITDCSIAPATLPAPQITAAADYYDPKKCRFPVPCDPTSDATCVPSYCCFYGFAQDGVTCSNPTALITPSAAWPANQDVLLVDFTECSAQNYPAYSITLDLGDGTFLGTCCAFGLSSDGASCASTPTAFCTGQLFDLASLLSVPSGACGAKETLDNVVDAYIGNQMTGAIQISTLVISALAANEALVITSVDPTVLKVVDYTINADGTGTVKFNLLATPSSAALSNLLFVALYDTTAQAFKCSQAVLTVRIPADAATCLASPPPPPPAKKGNGPKPKPKSITVPHGKPFRRLLRETAA